MLDHGSDWLFFRMLCLVIRNTWNPSAVRKKILSEIRRKETKQTDLTYVSVRWDRGGDSDHVTVC